MIHSTPHDCNAVIFGGSAGAKDTLLHVLKALPNDYRLPVFVCQHLHASDDGGFKQHLDMQTTIQVTEAFDKMPIMAGRVHVAPANYHLLVERNKTLALSIDAKVNWSRPSIDVLFESAAFVYGQALLGILLSGDSEDGVKGMGSIQQHGGVTVAQTPSTAKHPIMPKAAIERGFAHLVLSPEDIKEFVVRIHHDARYLPALSGRHGGQL